MNVKCLPKPVEWTATRMNHNLNYGLWVILKCQCRSISSSKGTSLEGDIDNEGGCAFVAAGANRENLCSFPSILLWT